MRSRCILVDLLTKALPVYTSVHQCMHFKWESESEIPPEVIPAPPDEIQHHLTLSLTRRIPAPPEENLAQPEEIPAPPEEPQQMLEVFIDTVNRHQ